MGKEKTKKSSLGLMDECITDAKALMEISLFNAQEKLKERFTPQLKSLIAKRLQQEEDDIDDDEEIEDTEDTENFDNVEDEEEIDIEDDEEMTPEEDNIDDDEEIDIDIEDDEDVAVEDLESSEMDLDIDNLDDEETNIEDDDEEEEIDLESIMKQMANLSEDDDEDIDIEDDDEDIDIDIEDDDEDTTIEDDDEDIDIEDDDEDIDIDIEDDDEIEENSIKERNAQLEAELKKYKAGAKLFKEKIAEQKFVQAKLLYVNDMLKRKKLSEVQKYKIVEAFDKAKSISDIKLIYKTLFEAYKERQKQIKETKPKALKEGCASKAMLVNRKKRIIENKNTNPMKDRYQILANIKK